MNSDPCARIANVEDMVGRYRNWLATERGLVDTTVKSYVSSARTFLSEFQDHDLSTLTLGDVNQYVVRACRQLRHGATANVAVHLRSLLRWLFLECLTVRELAAAVPVPKTWRGSLARALSAGDVSALVAAARCDQSAQGLRDHAIVLMMVRLGLRTSETASLALEDIDWERGEIMIRGKGNRFEHLPLPVDVGEAIVAYLRGGRPEVPCRTVFIRSKGAMTGISPGGIYHTVERACEKASISRVGPHRLRHSAATAMLRGGATLDEVGQVLRHRSSLTTAMYAKVDFSRLSALALPWPGGAA